MSYMSSRLSRDKMTMIICAYVWLHGVIVVGKPLLSTCFNIADLHTNSLSALRISIDEVNARLTST